MTGRSAVRIAFCAMACVAMRTVAPAAEPPWFPDGPSVWLAPTQAVGVSSADANEPMSDAAGEPEADASDESEAEASDAEQPDLDELLERLEKMEANWKDYQDELADEKKAAVSKPTLQINGRIHADYWSYPHSSQGANFFEHPDAALPNFGTDPEEFFAFRRVRLELKGDILETMLWRIQVDFNNPQTPEFKDVFIGFKELPNNQQLIVGIQKRPLNLDQLNSSRNNVFLERPAMGEAVNEDARRPGIALFGHSDDESIGWNYGAFLLENVTTDGRYGGDHAQASANGRLWTSPWYDESSDGRGYAHFAVAGMFANPEGNNNNRSTSQNEARFRSRPEARTVSRWLDTGQIAGAQFYEVLAAETILNAGPVQLVGEYAATWLQRHHASAGPDLFLHGGYVYASYFLTGEHIPYDRTTGTIGRVKPFENFFLVDRCCGGTGHGWGAWNVALRYDWLDLTDGDITGGVEHAATFALNWFFTPYSKLQFNLIYGTINHRGPIAGFDSGNYVIAGTRLAIEF